MRIKTLTTLISLFILSMLQLKAEEGLDHKDHKKDEGHKEHKQHDEHTKHEGAQHKNHKTDKRHKKHEEEGEHKEKHHEEEGKHKAKHDEHAGHGGQKAMGESKAIVNFDKQKGIRFSHEAVSTMQLQLKEIKEDKIFKVPDSGLVRQREQHAVYLYKNGFFNLFHVRVVEEHKKEGHFLVKLKKKLDLSERKLLLNNVNLVRVAEIYSQDDQEYSHAH